MKRGVKEKKTAGEIYSIMANNFSQDTVSEESKCTEEMTFSHRFEKRKKAVVRKYQVKKRLRYATAAAMSLLIIVSAGLTASGLWEEIWTLTLKAGEKFVSIFTGSQAEPDVREAKDAILVQKLPERFSLGEIENQNNLLFYMYTAENGDLLTVSEEKGNPDKEADAEAGYEVLDMTGRDVFLSYKEEKREYCIFFRYNSDTAVTITGNISRDEAMDIIQSVLIESK